MADPTDLSEKPHVYVPPGEIPPIKLMIEEAKVIDTETDYLEAKLAAAEARGGRIPHEEVVARLRARYGG